jgi:hypothetical protein
MILSVGSVLALVTFCITKVFSLPPIEADEALVSELEIDTRDKKDPD